MNVIKNQGLYLDTGIAFDPGWNFLITLFLWKEFKQSIRFCYSRNSRFFL